MTYWASSNCFSQCCTLFLPQARCHYRLLLSAGRSHHWLPPWMPCCNFAPEKTNNNNDDDRNNIFFRTFEKLVTYFTFQKLIALSTLQRHEKQRNWQIRIRRIYRGNCLNNRQVSELVICMLIIRIIARPAGAPWVQKNITALHNTQKKLN